MALSVFDPTQTLLYAKCKLPLVPPAVLFLYQMFPAKKSTCGDKLPADLRNRVCVAGPQPSYITATLSLYMQSSGFYSL